MASARGDAGDRSGEAWARDWRRFVQRVSALYDDGASDARMSEAFRDVRVRWEGVVKSVDLDQEYSPGVALSMGTPETRLSDGRTLRADHLMLFVDGAEAAPWRDVAVGDTVRFDAVPWADPVDANVIGLFRSARRPVVSLELGLVDCRLVERRTGAAR